MDCEPPGNRILTEEKQSFRKIFARDFPYFLSLGMTYEQYYYGDPLLVRDFLQAEVYRRKRDNYNMWLGGLYMREAIMSSIGNAFIGKGDPPYEYMDKPIPMDEEDIEAKKAEQEEREIEQAKVYMQLLVEQGKDWGKKEPMATQEATAL